MKPRIRIAAAQNRPLEEIAGLEELEGEWSDRKQDLRDVHERFESAFGNAPIGMALIDMDGSWLQVNNALCRIIGYSQTELRATTLRALTHPDDVDLDLPLLQQLIKGQIPSYQIEQRYRHIWSHFVWMLVTISLVRGHEGKPLCDPRLSGLVEGALAETGIDPACLVLELTETSAIANLTQARAFADRLHSCGCQVALDDFGMGFASFYYLKNFPFDYLKIDGEFIRELAVNPVDQMVVDAIVGIAHGMRKKTIAEFVGDANTARLLRNSGVDYAQGYHIGPPQPITEVLSVGSHNSADLPAWESLPCVLTPTDPWYMKAYL